MTFHINEFLVRLSSGILFKVSGTGSVSASGEMWEALTLLGPLERVNLNYWTLWTHLKTEADPVSVTSSFLEYRFSNVECVATLSEPFRIEFGTNFNSSKEFNFRLLSLYGAFSLSACGRVFSGVWSIITSHEIETNNKGYISMLGCLLRHTVSLHVTVQCNLLGDYYISVWLAGFIEKGAPTCYALYEYS
jgi:hypothetical protein